MLLLEAEELEEVHPSYGGHEVLIRIYADHSRRNQVISQAGETFTRNFPDLFLEIHLAILFPGIKLFVSGLGFTSLSLYPHCTIQTSHCLYYYRFPLLRSRLARNELQHVLYALRHDVPAVHRDRDVLVSAIGVTENALL